MAEFILRLTTYHAYLGLGHTYATIEAGDEDVYLTHSLTNAGVRRLLRYDPDAGYKAGDETERFDSVEQAVDAAREWMREHHPDDRLVSRVNHFSDGRNGTVYWPLARSGGTDTAGAADE